CRQRSPRGSASRPPRRWAGNAGSARPVMSSGCCASAPPPPTWTSTNISTSRPSTSLNARVTCWRAADNATGPALRPAHSQPIAPVCRRLPATTIEESPMRIAIASDHAGFDLKQLLMNRLSAEPDLTLIDLGTDAPSPPVDYPDYARAA